MSERCERSVSNISLLMGAAMSDATPGAEREALAEYKQARSQSDAANQRLRELNAMIKEMSYAGEQGSEKFNQCQTEAKKCVYKIGKFDRQALNLETNSLQPLLRRLRDRAYAEEMRLGKIALENYYREEAAHYEQVAQEWRAKREQALANREKNIKAKKSEELCALENELERVRKQVRQIEEDLSNLRFCWFGEKRRYKNSLQAEHSILQNRLLELYRKRRILESPQYTEVKNRVQGKHLPESNSETPSDRPSVYISWRD